MPGIIFPGIIQFVQMPSTIDLQAAENGHVDMTATDQAE
jgi:hypothetical protein